ncbi:MAG: helix-turn-helix transcriptional regulator [Alphaproteobacteria bacterium]|nr:helix-turn-helix transcriptional regulator [Alphaproteobacteria bacterium]
MSLNHAQVWEAIDALAKAHGYSPSGLARLAGLDPTTFNRSKRVTPGGKPRWPSTESISKILDATGASLDTFLSLLQTGTAREPAAARHLVPLIGLAQAGSAGYFDDAGFPAGTGWDEVEFPGVADEGAYALEISGDSMQPVYRDGDRIVVSPQATVRRGDRVVVRTREGEVMAKLLQRQTARTIELVSLNPAYPNRSLDMSEVDWIARIVWASQ